MIKTRSDDEVVFLLDRAIRNGFADLGLGIPQTQEQHGGGPKDRSSIPAGGAKRQKGIRVSEEQKIKIDQYLKSHENARILEVASHADVSTGFVSTFPVWRAREDRKRAARKDRSPKTRPLTDGILNSRGVEDDPSAALFIREAIEKWEDRMLGSFDEEQQEQFKKRPDHG